MLLNLVHCLNIVHGLNIARHTKGDKLEPERTGKEIDLLMPNEN